MKHFSAEPTIPVNILLNITLHCRPPRTFVKCISPIFFTVFLWFSFMYFSDSLKCWSFYIYVAEPLHCRPFAVTPYYKAGGFQGGASQACRMSLSQKRCSVNSRCLFLSFLSVTKSMYIFWEQYSDSSFSFDWNRQNYKQTDIQTKTHASKQTNRQTETDASKQTDMQYNDKNAEKRQRVGKNYT